MTNRFINSRNYLSFINNRNVFLTALDAAIPKSGYHPGRVLVRALFLA
jgi:hypothetical protein